MFPAISSSTKKQVCFQEAFIHKASQSLRFHLVLFQQALRFPSYDNWLEATNRGQFQAALLQIERLTFGVKLLVVKKKQT